jgi:hypothetical protein
MHRLFVALLIAAAAGLPGASRAQAYPDKPIRLVVRMRPAERPPSWRASCRSRCRSCSASP